MYTVFECGPFCQTAYLNIGALLVSVGIPGRYVVRGMWVIQSSDNNHDTNANHHSQADIQTEQVALSISTSGVYMPLGPYARH